MTAPDVWAFLRTTRGYFRAAYPATELQMASVFELGTEVCGPLTVTVKLSEPFSSFAGATTMSLEVEPGTTLGEVLNALAARAPQLGRLRKDTDQELRMVAIVHCGGKILSLGDKFHQDCTISVTPPLSGG